MGSMSMLGIAAILLLAVAFAACGGSPAASAPADKAVGGEASSAEDTPAAPAKVSAGGGKFTASGAMTDARQTAVAVLLPDGRVFVAGGRGKGSGRLPPRLETATIWDQSAGEWANVTSMEKEREEATAELLDDGRVIVLGGRDQTKFHRSIEIYDVTGDEWASGPRMKKKRFDHASVKLSNGAVLAIGGIDDFFAPMDVVEICPSAEEACEPTGLLTQARAEHTATLLSDGRILVAGGSRGGIGTDAPAFDTAEIYDPETGEWTVIAVMAVAHTRHTATLLEDGRVLVTGGRGQITEAELFDPATGNWSSAGSLSESRAHHTATLLADGRVLVSGGIGNVATTDIFDPATDGWARGPIMTESRYDHTATRLSDDRVLIVAGQTTDKNLDRELSNTSELWQP